MHGPQIRPEASLLAPYTSVQPVEKEEQGKSMQASTSIQVRSDVRVGDEATTCESRQRDQGWQVLAPAEEENVPNGHDRHEEASAAGENDPAGHALQPIGFDTDRVPPRTNPGAQTQVGPADPGSQTEKFPQPGAQNPLETVRLNEQLDEKL